MACLSCLLAAVLLIGSTGCAFLLPGRFWRLTGGSSTQILLASDTPEIRQLIADENAREDEVRRFFREPHTQEEGIEHVKDMMRHPDQYPPGRTEFLKAMAQMPGLNVPGKSYCEIIERSKSTCGRFPLETATFVLVQVTTGPSHGQRGWVCQNVVQGQFP